MSDFYIIGTKYGEHNDKDITPYLLDKQAIAIGFCWDTNLTKFYNGDLDKLDKLLRDKGEKPSTIAQVKRFLSLQPGDIIALKSVGSPIGTTARLEIVGYAVVAKRNGLVYRHDPDDFPKGLGHLINVDFLEFGIKRTLQLGYGRSIHQLQNKSHIDLVFGSYADAVSSINKSSNSSGTTQKNTSEKVVTVSANFIRKAIHNKIQQGVYDIFVELFGADSVKMEENFVDIVFTTDETTELIEVKPYYTATHCIREGLGQLLSYYQKHYSKRKNVTLTIIGSKEPNADDKKFIKFIQTTLNIKFRYDSWERLGSR
jgi:hypothetical protein